MTYAYGLRCALGVVVLTCDRISIGTYWDGEQRYTHNFTLYLIIVAPLCDGTFCSCSLVHT